MVKSLFNKDSIKILKNKKLLIAITAVIFIPILYAGMFLWAFWDPYAFLDDIPVAIVNEDEGYIYEGEELNIGSELIDNLKEEADFDFHFVSKTKGYQGLQAEDYYILIEIPKDFSQNATTVMDNPEKLELIYVPNESFNFLAAQMGETAMLQIQQSLQEEITKTYADTIFDKVEGVAGQLADATTGTEKLNDGAHELYDGSKEIADNLKTFTSKMDEFSDGVNIAYKGSEELATGSETLSSGIGELYENSVKLRDASIDIQNGASTLANGMKQANDGVSQLQDNIPALIAGTDEVYNGLTTLHNQLPKEMAGKVSETVSDQMAPLRQKIKQLLDHKKDELAPTISEQLSNKISQGAAESVVGKANELINDAPVKISKSIAKQITEMIKNKTALQTENIQSDVDHILQDASLPEATIQEVLSKIGQLTPDYEAIETAIQQRLEAVLDDQLAGIHITEAQQKELEQLIKDKAEEQINSGVNDALDRAIGSVDGLLDEYETIILDKLADVTISLEDEIKQALDEPIGQLQTGLLAINDGQTLLLDGVDNLANGTNELTEGTEQLRHGQNDYVSNIRMFTNSFTNANNGAHDLATGSNDLYSGMFTLQDGAGQLQDGSTKLAEGSTTLHDGMKTLVDGTEVFNEKMHDASNQANDVNPSEQSKTMIASPVEVDNEKINEVPNYGTGFAPYFLSLGLFVGALLLSIVYPLRETSSRPSSGTEWFLRKFSVLFLIGILQALIASGILLLGLGIEVQSVPKFILFAIITSLTFITLIQFFVTCFDDPGRFIAIIILILQLTTSAGTFPLELIPKVLQPLNNVLPMTYSVAGFKAVISSGNYSVMWQNAGILLTFTMIFVVLTWTYFIVKYKRTHQLEEINETI